jgi:hypothetical protein
MARREPHWVKLFLRELEATGNVRLAAEGAGVDFSTAYQRRKRHAEFGEAWAGALAVFASRSEDQPDLRRAPSTIPSLGNGPPPRAGEDLIVRPSTDGSGSLVRAPHALTSPRWGKRAQEAFLAKLTLSANVRHSAKKVGFSTQAVYKRRLKDRHFAAAWDAAVEVGKASVQAYLVEAAKRTFDPDELPIGDEREIDRVSISEAINIAKLRAAGPPPQADDAEGYDEDHLKEVRERILEKLKRLREREIANGWTPHALAAPLGRDGSIREVWIPPGYRLVRDEEPGLLPDDG